MCILCHEYRNNSMKTVSSINVEEVTKFEKLANEWWDEEGKFKPLHMLNPCRLEFITDHLSMHFKKDLTIDSEQIYPVHMYLLHV